jgi:hypothetical protein
MTGNAGFESPIEFVIEKYKSEGTNKASFSGFAIIKARIIRLTGPNTRPKTQG